MFDAIERLDACVNSSQIASNSNAEVNYFLDSRAIPPDVSVLFTSGSLNSHSWIGVYVAGCASNIRLLSLLRHNSLRYCRIWCVRK